MPKTNILKIGIVVLLIVFCLHLNGRSIAGDCDDLGHSKGTPIITGNHSYPAGWLSTADSDIEYDTENSAETVDRNDSATISVIGNNAPFTWSVSGIGFTLDNAKTTGFTNTLNADNTACGSTTITVTGCDGTVATGYVRCTTGQWGTAQSGCILSGTPDTHSFNENSGILVMTKTQGKYLQENKVLLIAGCSCATLDCSDSCDNESPHGNCIGCITCLGPEFCAYTTHGGTPYVQCSEWCCGVTGCTEIDPGYCFCTLSLDYKEWECVQ